MVCVNVCAVGSRAAVVMKGREADVDPDIARDDSESCHKRFLDPSRRSVDAPLPYQTASQSTLPTRRSARLFRFGSLGAGAALEVVLVEGGVLM